MKNGVRDNRCISGRPKKATIFLDKISPKAMMAIDSLSRTGGYSITIKKLKNLSSRK